MIVKKIFIATALVILIGGCGGGGGGGAAVSNSGSGSTPSPVTTPTPTPSTTPLVTFNNALIHDTDLVVAGNNYYIFGSHLAAASSTDLMNWTTFANGVTSTNPLFANVVSNLASTFAWSTVTDLWRPAVFQLPDGNFYMYYDSCQGSSPLSSMGVAVATQINGPYVNKATILQSGNGVPNYDQTVMPNAIDPYLFYDASHKLWMIYGSYSGGIFILAIDPTTGLPVAGQGYGKHLMGGNNSPIEGSNVLYVPQTGYYYLFSAFGGMTYTDGYNIRVARSVNPDGPYLDGQGNDMSTVKSNINLPFPDYATIAPYGQELMGNYQFNLAAGESGTPLGYMSPGGASTYYRSATNEFFIIFHTLFPNQGNYFEARVHSMYINSDGWPVIAPLRYAPLSLNPTNLSPTVASTDVAGTYKLVNFGKAISGTINQSQVVQLNADGTISGAVSGTWTYQGANSVVTTVSNITISIGTSGSGGVFNGVLSRQFNTNSNSFEVTFSALSNGGVTLWAVRTGS